MERAFDRAYYERFYVDPRTRVCTPEDTDRLCRFVCAYLDFLGVEVRQVLDVGCGLGYWRDSLRTHAPKARYTGIEVSEYLCRRYGWKQASIADWRPARRFDLVVCQGVLQYLDDAEAERALENLGVLCRGALYLEVLTTEDWERNCDRERTDGAVRLRHAAWYRRHLTAQFVNAGGGVFLRHTTPVTFYELERPNG